jgi:hypothetical protein
MQTYKTGTPTGITTSTGRSWFNLAEEVCELFELEHSIAVIVNLLVLS